MFQITMWGIIFWAWLIMQYYVDMGASISLSSKIKKQMQHTFTTSSDMMTFMPEVGISGMDKLLHPTDYCGMQLLIHAWDTFFWHQSSHVCCQYVGFDADHISFITCADSSWATAGIFWDI